MIGPRDNGFPGPAVALDGPGSIDLNRIQITAANRSERLTNPSADAVSFAVE